MVQPASLVVAAVTATLVHVVRRNLLGQAPHLGAAVHLGAPDPPGPPTGTVRPAVHVVCTGVAPSPFVHAPPGRDPRPGGPTVDVRHRLLLLGDRAGLVPEQLVAVVLAGLTADGVWGEALVGEALGAWDGPGPDFTPHVTSLVRRVSGVRLVVDVPGVGAPSHAGTADGPEGGLALGCVVSPVVLGDQPSTSGP